MREWLSKSGEAKVAKIWVRIFERRELHGERALEIHGGFLYFRLYTSLYMNRMKLAQPVKSLWERKSYQGIISPIPKVYSGLFAEFL